MHSWIEEFSVMVIESKKIVIAAIFGVLFIMIVILAGYFQLIDFELNGPLKGIEQVTKKALYDRYLASAFASLLSF